MIKALRIGIFENKKIGNCSNNGISNRFDSLLLIHHEGTVDIDLNNPPENLVKLVIMEYGQRKHMYLEPVTEDAVWHSFGGCYAGCSDQRFCDISDYPLPIHDRREW